ncbi:MAG TPA: hypothetical protein VHR84_00220 [Terriglobales bacterium]|jgi:hypothetical protein|nr:hypothetical protein [Terriglobales bacterium]
MLHQFLKVRTTLVALIAAVALVTLGVAQNPSQVKPNTAKPAAPANAAPAKATPAKPAPTQNAAHPVTPTQVMRSNTVAPATGGRGAVPTTAVTPSANNRNVITPTSNQASPGGRTPIPTNTGIVPNGKGAAIGTIAGANAAPASTNGAAPVSVRGRPPIPGTASTQGTVAAPAGRAPIPGTPSSTVVPASSSSYIGSSGGGRSPIPTYASAAPVASGGQEQAVAGPNGSYGSYQYGTGMLTIYGCARQGNQVVCDMDFNNQNQHQTMVNTQWWRDMYVVDAFGDRHQRGSAYFVNGAGEPRETLDIPYGQTARYIMVFNEVPANAPTVSLHSPYGSIDIENIGLDGGGAAAQGGGQAVPAQNVSQGGNAVTDTANGMKDTATNAGKQHAADARDKAVNKANDSLQKMLNKLPK